MRMRMLRSMKMRMVVMILTRDDNDTSDDETTVQMAIVRP